MPGFAYIADIKYTLLLQRFFRQQIFSPIPQRTDQPFLYRHKLVYRQAFIEFVGQDLLRRVCCPVMGTLADLP